MVLNEFWCLDHYLSVLWWYDWCVKCEGADRLVDESPSKPRKLSMEMQRGLSRMEALGSWMLGIEAIAGQGGQMLSIEVMQTKEVMEVQERSW